MGHRVIASLSAVAVVVAILSLSALPVAAQTAPRTPWGQPDWTSSWTASVPLVLNPEPMFEYPCHEGNYSMPVMLGGKRAEELGAAEQP